MIQIKWSISLLILFCFTACKNDNNPEAADPLLGNWLSSGNMVSPFLSQFSQMDSIKLYFGEDGSYEMEQINADGLSLILAGGFLKEQLPGATLFNISLIQQSPQAAIQEGIGQISNTSVDTLKLEIVQVDPFAGFSPPNTEDGLGSSNEGLLGNTNIQRFIRYNP